ncbi:hypothetical protein SLEP1_g14748 [Rubroshorea leprosula]|uniref:Expansin n=1 Tax=Rubroshorea leprosula TaxID=152421 RepID=A0AAV5IVJ9_9ROSI|nr:hypothetical protein SLEP1_g14748 [Rubroshorea leprosula]
MCEERWDQIHHQWPFVLQPGADNQCGRSRRYHGGVHQGISNRVASRNWGQNLQCNSYLNGQGLSFKITTSDGRIMTQHNVVHAGWQFGQTFEGYQF